MYMNEEQTKKDYVEPKLKASGWEAHDARVLVEHKLTDGKITPGGRRAAPKFADYVLEYKGKKLAVVEAKRLDLGVTEGLEQAKEYGKMLDLDFVYSTNGAEIYEFSLKAGDGKVVESFPTPQELWQKHFSKHNEWKKKFTETPFGRSGNKTPRYYQEIAVSRALDAIAEGKKRILLTLATGTGKTYIASQIAYKLYEARWSLDKNSGRRPRILFIADRNVLASQAMADFDIFTDEQKERITPASIRKAGNELPHNASVFFTIFQTLTGENGYEMHYQKYEPDFFDLVIIDECHRGGANDESRWRGILEYFAPAVQLGLTATPKREGNVDTYEYFGTPVYEYSLKAGIEDGYLTPFKVKKFTTSLDTYRHNPNNEVVAGEIDEEREYVEKDFANSVIEIKKRDEQRVKLMLENINQNEKTIVFCANQSHAAFIRDLIQNYADSDNPDYCVRVTANDGVRGDNYLKQFRNTEETIPTILTTSQKLSTGVDARNVRNIVLMRPVNSMIEFKQIVGRGTRVFEGKQYFTILDFVKAYEHFNDPEWDGPPIDKTTVKMERKNKKDHDKRKFDDEPENDEEESRKRPEKIKVKLGPMQEREMWGNVETLLYSADGKPISSEEFLKNIFGTLPEFFKDEKKLREIWSNPKTREIFLRELDKKGFDESQLKQLQELVDAKDSDLFDVFEYVAFDRKPLSRHERVARAKRRIFDDVDEKTREFLEFVLNAYERDGYEALKETNLPEFLKLKYGSPMDAQNIFGDLYKVQNKYYSLQEILYSNP